LIFYSILQDELHLRPSEVILHEYTVLASPINTRMSTEKRSDDIEDSDL